MSNRWWEEDHPEPAYEGEKRYSDPALCLIAAAFAVIVVGFMIGVYRLFSNGG